MVAGPAGPESPNAHARVWLLHHNRKLQVAFSLRGPSVGSKLPTPLSGPENRFPLLPTLCHLRICHNSATPQVHDYNRHHFPALNSIKIT